jgi:predicted nucleotidyltransferase
MEQERIPSQIQPAATTTIAVFDRVVTALSHAARDHYGPGLVSLALFGSVARGTMRSDSDVDILVVVDSLPKGRLRRVEQFRPVRERVASAIAEATEAGIQTRLSPVFKTPGEIEAGSPLLLDMTEDARLLFDRGNFLARRLAELRGRLDCLGARRVWLGDAWYWDLKPDFRPGEVVAL